MGNKRLRHYFTNRFSFNPSWKVGQVVTGFILRNYPHDGPRLHFMLIPTQIKSIKVYY